MLSPGVSELANWQGQCRGTSATTALSALTAGMLPLGTCNQGVVDLPASVVMDRVEKLSDEDDTILYDTDLHVKTRAQKSDAT